MRTLGILLTTSPESENTHTAIRLAEAALAQGVGVRVFVMCDGVYNLNQPEFMSLAQKGASIAVCAHNANERSVIEKPGVVWGGQYDLAANVSECDRFLSFN